MVHVRHTAAAIAGIWIMILHYNAYMLLSQRNNQPPPPPPPPPCNCPPIINLNSSIPARQFPCKGQSVHFTCMIVHHVPPGPQVLIISWRSNEYIGQGKRLAVFQHQREDQADNKNDNITTRAEFVSVHHENSKVIIVSRLYIDSYSLYSEVSCSTANEDANKSIALQFLEHPGTPQKAMYLKVDERDGCKLYLFWSSPNNTANSGGAMISYNISISGTTFTTRDNMKVFSSEYHCDQLCAADIDITINTINKCNMISQTTSFVKIPDKEHLPLHMFSCPAISVISQTSNIPISTYISTVGAPTTIHSSQVCTDNQQRDYAIIIIIFVIVIVLSIGVSITITYCVTKSFLKPKNIEPNTSSDAGKQ